MSLLKVVALVLLIVNVVAVVRDTSNWANAAGAGLMLGLLLYGES